MYIRLAATVLLMVAACAKVSAQPYQIRVTHDTNLRASYSLNSAVLATAPAGSTLQVVGHYADWLTIDHDGATVWLADWVEYTRLDPAHVLPIVTDLSPSEYPPQPDIDNCCYLDRECKTDDEWAAGERAYQNNLCSANQSISCCDRGWLCTFDFDAYSGKWFWQHNGFCTSPTLSVYDGVIIEGSNRFIHRVRSALDRIKSRSPEWYAYVISGALKIREVSNSRTLTGSGAPGRSMNLLSRDARPEDWLIAAIVHENCHVQRMLAGLRDEMEWRAEESVCDSVATNALKAIAPGSTVPYPQERIDEFLRLGLDYDLDASAKREWERAQQVHLTRSY